MTTVPNHINYKQPIDSLLFTCLWTSSHRVSFYTGEWGFSLCRCNPTDVGPHHLENEFVFGHKYLDLDPTLEVRFVYLALTPSPEVERSSSNSPWRVHHDNKVRRSVVPDSDGMQIQGSFRRPVEFRILRQKEYRWGKEDNVVGEDQSIVTETGSWNETEKELRKFWTCGDGIFPGTCVLIIQWVKHFLESLRVTKVLFKI